MVVKSFYKNQRELANAINKLVDMYWENNLAEELLIENISNIFTNNTDKILKDNKFTKILQQQCGKKRLDIVQRIIRNAFSYPLE